MFIKHFYSDGYEFCSECGNVLDRQYEGLTLTTGYTQTSIKLCKDCFLTLSDRVNKERSKIRENK